MTHRINLLFNLLLLPIQKTEIPLPGDSKDARKHKAILRHDEPKTECRNSRPQFQRVDYAGWHGSLDACDDSVGTFTRQHRLHAEEVGIEDWCEDSLVDSDFDSDGQCFGCVVEVAAKEEEPVFGGRESLCQLACFLIPLDALEFSGTQKVIDNVLLM